MCTHTPLREPFTHVLEPALIGPLLTVNPSGEERLVQIPASSNPTASTQVRVK